jgi:hypothetical protein
MELLAKLSNSVSDPQAAVEIAKQIVELQTRQEELRQKSERFEWEKLDRQARVAYAEAFERFKANAPKILKTKHVNFKSKDTTKPDTSYWHVELDKACDLLIPALLKEGLTHRWKSADMPGGYTRVTCFIRHRLGYEEEGASLAGPADQSGGKNPIQGVGSSTSYLERYTFLATCGIVPTGMDNDGADTVGIAFNGNDGEGDQWIAKIREAATPSDLMKVWIAAQNEAKKLTPWDYKAMTIFSETRDERGKELKKAAK